MANNYIKLKKKEAEISLIQHELHKEIVNKFRPFFIGMDLLVVCMILFNFGAAFLTSFIVVEKEPTIQVYETNPVVAAVGNKETTPEYNKVYYLWIFYSFGWLIMIFCYILTRKRVYTNLGLVVLFSMVLFLFLTMGKDFFNDFGFYIGRVVFN